MLGFGIVHPAVSGFGYKGRLAGCSCLGDTLAWEQGNEDGY